MTEVLEDGTTIETTVKSGATRINAPESFVDAVLGAGFDVLTNANNHIYDRGVDGIEKTMQVLQDCGVFHTGASMRPKRTKNR